MTRITTLAALLLWITRAHAGGDRIDVAVTGSIDASLLTTSVARELATPIAAVAPDQACRTPCLAISVHGTMATAAFTTSAGVMRQRTIELGNDPTRWTDMITRLAGDVVRDEARGLLAEPGTETVVVPEDTSTIAFGLVPGISTDLFELRRSHRISIGLVAGSSGAIHGVAVSGVVDVSASVSGAQVAGAVAVTGTSSGVQVAGAVSVSTEATTQIAGGVNVTGHLTGVQVAPINIARRNDGVQVGVINVGGGADGEAFGLVNIVPGGRTDLEAAVDSDRIGTVVLRHGGRRWHNVYGLGGQHVSVSPGASNDDVWMFGFGVGPSFQVASLPVDLEMVVWHANHGLHYETGLSLLNQLRLSFAVPVGPLELVAGGALNVFVSDDHASPLFGADSRSADPTATSVMVELWPSVFVGGRI